MTIRLKPLGSVLFFFFLIFILAGAARAASVKADVYLTAESGQGAAAGTVTFTDDTAGINIVTDLKGLPPGDHGFHVHEFPDCGNKGPDGKTGPALAAGGHFDPDKTGVHKGPDSGGHKGDLPLLTVASDGTAKVTLHVKGVKAEEFKNRSVMIHAGGDNYSDQPAPLGGGGGRIACGIIQ